MSGPFLEVDLEFKTPLWTGNLYNKDRKDRDKWEIKESSLIGTLRFWYEALLRGIVSGYNSVGNKFPVPACDPSKKECNKDKHSKKECNKDKHCMACELFGCNGVSRKFILHVSGDLEKSKIPYSTVKRRKERGFRPIGGFCFSNCNDLKFTLLSKLNPLTDLENTLLKYTFYIISEYGCWGGRTSQGNGLSIYSNKPNIQKPAIIKSDLKKELSKFKSSEPDLCEFPKIDRKFFSNTYEIEFSDKVLSLLKYFWEADSKVWEIYWRKYNFIPIGFHIRDGLRQGKYFYPSKDEEGNPIPRNEYIRHDLFGFDKTKTGAKVRTSHAYKVNDNKVRFKIYGFGIEDKDINKFNNETYVKEDILKGLFKPGKSNSINLNIINKKRGNELYTLL